MRRPAFALEFAVVLTAGFGYFVFTSLFAVAAMLSSSAGQTTTVDSGDGIYRLMMFEIALFTFIAGFLARRGWRWRDFRLHVSAESTLHGIVLFGAAHLTYVLAYALLYPLIGPWYGEGVVDPFASSAEPGAVIALAVINSVFEEVLVVGYVIRALEGRVSKATAVNISVFVRLLYHLYQGPIAIASIIPTGLLFAWYYQRFGRLWPLIVAHAVTNVVAYSF